MKKITLALLIVAALHCNISSCQNTDKDNKGNSMSLSLSTKSGSIDSESLPGLKNPPQAGSTVRFTYTPKNELKNAKEVKGLVYIYVDYKWKLDDVETTKKGQGYVCSYQIPKDCAFLAFKFYANTSEGIIEDTNKDEGYLFTTVDSKNQKVPGSDVAWGTFRNANLNSDFGHYFNQFSISDEASEFWVKKEIQEHPEKFPLFVDTYFKIAKLRKPEKFDTIAGVLAHQFLENYKDLSEGQYMKIQELYAFDLNEREIGDSLQEVIVKRFPKGYTARLKAFQRASQISDISQKVRQFESFLQKYPVNELGEGQAFFYRNIFNFLGEHYFNAEQYDALKALLPQMNFGNIVEVYHFTISKAYHFKSVPLPVLNNLSQLMIAALRAKLHDSSYKQGIYLSPQQALENAIDQLDRKIKIQVRISADLNNYPDVIKYWEDLSEGTKYKDSEINEIYIQALNSEKKEITQALEAAAANTALTPPLKEFLKNIYSAKNGSDTGFQAYLNNFKNNDLKAELQDKLIDQETPELIFEDYQGEDVRIPSKDKIIILDFWANWCAPCKKSFPAMQQLVENYKNDKTVAFYFINVNETKKDYKALSASYFKENQLDELVVLFDQKGERKRTNNVTFSKFASLFNSSGIPRKVVIKNGKIRFTSEGYSGNPDELKEEITTVIELLKTEN